MKKIFIFSILCVFSVFLSGCGKTDNKLAKIEENKFSIKDLMEQKVEQECHFNASNIGDYGNLEYTIFFKGSNMKVETIMNGKKYFTLTDDDFFYSWSELNNSGIKMKLTDSQTEADTSSIQDYSNLDFEDSLGYECEKKHISDDTMVIPSDIIFTDLSQDFGQLYAQDNEKKGEVNSDSNQYCNMCDMLSGVEKESCLTDLGC